MPSTVAAAIRDYKYTRTHLIPYPPARNYSIRSILGGIFPEIEISKDSRAQWSGAYYQLPDASIRSSRLGRVVSSFLPRALAYSKAERTDKVVHYKLGVPKQISLPVRIVASTIVAASGGALLIVPMVIMSFNTNHNKSLITVSCAVLLFAFFLAAVMRSKTTEIFIATATYAAVLVVFVGTGTGSGTGSG